MHTFLGLYLPNELYVLNEYPLIFMKLFFSSGNPPCLQVCDMGMAITAVACSDCSQGFGVNPYVSAAPHRF